MLVGLLQINKWTVPGASTTSQVRSLRKANNDQVAIAIDTEADGSRIEDEDDDKGNLPLIARVISYKFI